MPSRQAALTAAIICIASIAALPAGAVTRDGGQKAFEVSRTDTPPVIDGRLDDPAWASAAPVDDFHQTIPTDGAAPTERTVVRVTYDDEFLYIAADLRDSDPDAIQASQMIQGKLFFSDDRFWVMLDSFNSKRNDYLFQVNANGVRREVLRENNSRFIEEWATIWHAESAVHDNGWATEMAIPFKSLSFDPTSDTWGINFGRGIVRKQETALWSSRDRQDWPAYGGEVSGLTGLKQGIGLDVVPSVTVSRRRDLVLGESGNDVEPSLDIRYRVTPSLTATFTLNTDFSTAEVDDQQIALDRFSLFFPEKRDFFLQDAGIFEFGNIDQNGRPFFSRRIGLSAEGIPVDITGGAKLTGRVGDFSIGALAIRQEEFGGIDATDLVVARGSMNVLDESALGFIATYGDPGSNASNSVIGTDFLYRNSDGPFGLIMTSNLWAQQSNSTGLSGDDRAFGATLAFPNDRVDALLKLEEIQENFNPALGFVNRVGIRRGEAYLRYRHRPESGPFRAINHRIDVSQVRDMNDNVLSDYLRIRPIVLETHTGDFGFVAWERNEERVLADFELFGRLNVPAGSYTFERVRAEVFTGQQRPVNVGLSVQDGDFFGGERLQKYAEITWRQSAHFSLTAIFEQNDIDLPSGSFTLNLASLKTDVALNPRWSWSSFVQYNNAIDAVGINSRLRFIPEAGKEMLFVLNHAADVDDNDRFTSTANELNLKLTYTFRY